MLNGILLSAFTHYDLTATNYISGFEPIIAPDS